MGFMMFGGLIEAIAVVFLLFHTSGGNRRNHDCPHCGGHGFTEHHYRHYPPERKAQFDREYIRNSPRRRY